MAQYQVHLSLQGPIVPGGLPHSAPSFPLPQHLRHLSDEQRVALLAEEAKRAKRNHKIHLLSKDNGLMTPQDKNFVTRIQLQQLVSAAGNPNENGTDDALAEDFYYQVHSHIRRAPRASPQQPLNQFAQTYLHQTGARQGGASGRRLQRGGDSHVQRMEQQVQRAVEAAKLRPKSKQIVLEGTLGKISFSNSKTPKPLLNIKRAESGSDNNGRPQGPSRAASDRRSQPYNVGARHRQESLRQIEDVYVALMRMEDHERCMPPQQTPDGSRAVYEQWTQEMKRLNQRLWEELKVLDPIVPK
jgi:DNA topoisomerase 2-associated protein PAT1